MFQVRKEAGELGLRNSELQGVQSSSVMESASQFSFLFSGTPALPKLSPAELRDSGMESVLRHTPETWKESFVQAILNRVVGSKFTMEEIRDQVGDPPYDVHPNCFGAITYHLAKKGLIEKTGETVKTHRTSRRNSDCPIWRRSEGQRS